LLEQLVERLGLTLVFISHDLSVIRRLCSRVIVMHHGKILENRETKSIFEAPQSEYTRELIDAIPLPDPAQVWV
jgi:peptide/nickel transport system ATP-binding protein